MSASPTHSSTVAKPDKPRRPWWRFFVQFSLRTLLIVITLAAVACWWFLQPQTREEELAGKCLKLWREVHWTKTEVWGAPAKEFRAINAGAWRLRNQNGDLLVDGKYENELPQGKWTIYHANGRKAAEGFMLHGARTGVWHTWDEEGHLLSEVSYIATKEQVPTVAMRLREQFRTIRHGPARAWYPSGQLKFAGSYQDDRREGPWTFYDEIGQVTATEFYRAGQRNNSPDS
jgi:MORN repeat variant